MIIIILCGDNSIAGFDVEEGNGVGLNEGFGVSSFDSFVHEGGTVVGLFGGSDKKIGLEVVTHWAGSRS